MILAGRMYRLTQNIRFSGHPSDSVFLVLESSPRDWPADTCMCTVLIASHVFRDIYLGWEQVSEVEL